MELVFNSNRLDIIGGKQANPGKACFFHFPTICSKALFLRVVIPTNYKVEMGIPVLPYLSVCPSLHQSAHLSRLFVPWFNLETV